MLWATGCTKEQNEGCPDHCTLVTGRLHTSGLKPLAEVPVTAKGSPGHSLLNLPRTKARATTDAQGNYQVRFLVQDDELHHGYFQLTYELNPNRYYAIGNTDSPDTGGAGLQRDTTYRLSPFLIPPKAFVQLTVPKQAQIQPFFGGFYQCPTAHINRYEALDWRERVHRHPSAARPFTKLVEIAGDQAVHVRATRSRQNGHTSTVDSIVVAAGSTRAHRLVLKIRLPVTCVF